MYKRPVKILIEDIWEAIEKIERYTTDITQEVFRINDKTVDANDN